MDTGTTESEPLEPPSSKLLFGEQNFAVSFNTEKNHPLPQKKNKVINLKLFYGSARFRYNPHTYSFRKKYFPNVSSTEWNDWHWQLSNRITDIRGLQRILNLSIEEERAVNGFEKKIPLAITPYYSSLIEKDNPSQPLRKAVIPTVAEYSLSPGESDDPLGEEHDSPVPGLIHRYPDRVLFLVTDFCSTYCRYCTRSRILGKKGRDLINKTRWEKAIAYIERNPSVRDVLLSGGDPFTLSDENLEWLLSNLRRIPHVEFLRIGTKVPVVLPQRITPSLTRMLKKYHPLWISIHCTHPDELTPETNQAFERLADAGIPLGSQTVLLRGINDNVETMKRLFHGLLKNRVKPYYLYQCDPIPGSAHFRTPVDKGLEIIRRLRGYTTGYAVPTYVIDAPGGGGKIPMLPDYLVGRDGKDLVLKNYKGDIYRYPDQDGWCETR